MNTQTTQTDHSKIVAASIEGKDVILAWSDGVRNRLPGIFFRHSPGFPGGKRPAGESGRFPRTPDTLVPNHAEITTDGGLRLLWNPDQLESVHEASWLNQNLGAHRSTSKPVVNTWDSRSITDLPHHEFQQICDDQNARFKLFEQMIESGVALVRNAPLEPNSMVPLAGMFGELPVNLYAEDPENPAVANIRINPDVRVATNMCHFLGPHIDTCWRQTINGLLFMHCLNAHPEGGRSLVVDGFAVAELLKKQSPESFELLSTVPLSFEANVSDMDKWLVKGKILSVSADDTLEGVRYNGNSIGQLDLPIDLIEPMYKALEEFEAILYDPSFWWQPKLAPGDILIMDNQRVLHGCEAFDPDKAERHLQTCSVDRDSFHNTFRRIARELGSTSGNRRLTAGVI